MKKLFWLCLFVLVIVAGCGSGNMSTSGTIAMTSGPAVANGVVSATATYTPSSGTALPNTPMTFHWSAKGVSTNTDMTSYLGTPQQSTSGPGVSIGNCTLQGPRAENMNVFVWVETGGLATDTKTVLVLTTD